MILKVGDELEINGKQGIVCFTTQFEDNKYICIAFEEEQLFFNIYEYKYENDKLLVGKVEDPKEMEEVLKSIIKENADNVDFSEEIKTGFARLLKSIEE